uniref:Uncharacterized protein n=1 Tax=Arundo donax TaxID=35708 RepID=A0A0A9TWJ6_ARUDO
MTRLLLPCTHTALFFSTMTLSFATLHSPPPVSGCLPGVGSANAVVALLYRQSVTHRHLDCSL